MSDPIRRRAPLLPLLLLPALPLAAACGTTGGAGPTAASPYLDGSRTSFVVVGYSTSFAWPDMLQEMLDQHAGRAGVYHVLNATAGGAAVEIWLADPGSDDHERGWNMVGFPALHPLRERLLLGGLL